MALKNRIIGFAAAVLFVSPAAALAGNAGYDVNGKFDGKGGVDIGVHIHGPSCRHDAPPPAPPPQARPAPSGRYELRPVQRWTPGYEERVWVAEQCTSHTETKHKKKNGKGHGWGNQKQKHTTKTVTVCEPGHYASQWIEGRHVTEEQWVWVETPLPPRHLSFLAAR